MIEEIEELGAELQAGVFREVKLAAHGEVGLPGGKTAQRISAQIALLACGRKAIRPLTTRASLVGSEVKCLATGELRPVEVEGYTRYQVWPREELGAADRDERALNVHWEGRPRNDQVIN